MRSNGLAAISVAVALSGCAADPVDYDYRVRFPIAVEERIAILDLGSPATEGARLSAFARDFLKQGSGRVGVLVTAPADGDASAIALAQEIGGALVRRGLSEQDFELRLLVEPAAERHAVLHFAWYAAKVPQCPFFDRQFEGDLDNAPSSNFGCSIQRNIGLMALDPRDLTTPREGRGRDGARANDVVDKYRRGAAIAGAKEITPTPAATGGGK